MSSIPTDDIMLDYGKAPEEVKEIITNLLTCTRDDEALEVIKGMSKPESLPVILIDVMRQCMKNTGHFFVYSKVDPDEDEDLPGDILIRLNESSYRELLYTLIFEYTQRNGHDSLFVVLNNLLRKTAVKSTRLNLARMLGV